MTMSTPPTAPHRECDGGYACAASVHIHGCLRPSVEQDRLLRSGDGSELREAFVRRLTVDSPHRDRRRKDYNQAIFMPHGPAVWSSTDLDMVLRCFDDAVRDLGRTSL